VLVPVVPVPVLAHAVQHAGPNGLQHLDNDQLSALASPSQPSLFSQRHLPGRL
jgi:hypothetical protein